ncbi:hypothetical protein Tco_0930831 [Tanacetum coccineum]
MCLRHVAVEWELCVHAMAGYMHMKMNPDLGVDECQPPSLPLVKRKMPGRPRKRRIRHPTKDEDHAVTRVGRVMHCHKCWKTGYNNTRCTNQERPKPAYLMSKGIMFYEALSSSMPSHTATPSTSNTMPPPPTPSTSNTMPPPHRPSPSTSNTMSPPSGSNTMPPPPTPFSSNTMPSHATPGRPTKSSAFSIRGGSRGGAIKRGRSSSKRGRGSNTMLLQGLRDESSDEEHQFKMDIEAVYEMEREQIAIDKDDQFWEDCAREFDHVEEHKAQDKAMAEDVSAGKQLMAQEKGMPEDVSVGKQLMAQDKVEANPKPIRSKKSKAAEDPNKMRIFHKNRGKSERIFDQKMKIFKFDEHDYRSTPYKAFDV